jgi:hypothetical protein
VIATRICNRLTAGLPPKNWTIEKCSSARLIERAQIEGARELKRFAVEHDFVISPSLRRLSFSARLGLDRVDPCRRNEHVINVSIRSNRHIVKDAAAFEHELI